MDQPDDRITKIEETQAFADHKVDQLAQQVLALNTRLTEILRRLGTIEGRLVREEEAQRRRAEREPEVGEPD
jgi:uncharacterized coiled-coil protein SlyX